LVLALCGCGLVGSVFVGLLVLVNRQLAAADSKKGTACGAFLSYLLA
jgi:hypothetical protein